MTAEDTICRCELMAHFLSKVADASHLEDAKQAGRAALTELTMVREYLRQATPESKIPASVRDWMDGK